MDQVESEPFSIAEFRQQPQFGSKLIRSPFAGDADRMCQRAHWRFVAKRDEFATTQCLHVVKAQPTCVTKLAHSRTKHAYFSAVRLTHWGVAASGPFIRKKGEGLIYSKQTKSCFRDRISVVRTDGDSLHRSGHVGAATIRIHIGTGNFAAMHFLLDTMGSAADFVIGT